jgi:DNA repair protein RadA/Sms
MGRPKTILACSECGHQTAQWAGRCSACGAWGTIAAVAREVLQAGPTRAGPAVVTLRSEEEPDRRIGTGFPGIDRVLGGGLVPASVVLLAGEPGIGKSTLLLQLMARLSAAGLTCLYASGEESRGQVAARGARLGVDVSSVGFVPGRELPDVVDAALAERPSVLAVDSIQTLREPSSSSLPGGPSQVRLCADALVGLAKSEGIAVIVTGHVTKEGDLAGPRTLEHAVDVVLSFEGDVRSGLRVLAGGKNRFGQEGEAAWFEMERAGLVEVDPGAQLAPGSTEPGAATALLLAGRRALAIEVQALAAETDGPPRRQAAGLDPRRFAMIAAVVDGALRLGLGRRELYGASAGGLRVDDPACDLAVAAALASAAAGRPPPDHAAFVGEVSLTGQIRPAPGMDGRVAAARAAGVGTIYAASAAPGAGREHDVRIVGVRHVRDALRWAGPASAAGPTAEGGRRREEPVPGRGRRREDAESGFSRRPRGEENAGIARRRAALEEVVGRQ